MAPCSEHMLNETIVWRGRPDLSKAALDRVLTALISSTAYAAGCSVVLIMLDHQYFFFHQFFPVIVSTVGYFVAFFLVSCANVLSYEYRITEDDIFVRKWRNHEEDPLRQIKEIKCVGKFHR